MPRLDYRQIGELHVFTSPDVPGLYVADYDKQKALDSVPGVVAMLQRINDRTAKRAKLKEPQVAARA